MSRSDKIVIVTKKTPLQELVERFGSKDQARFYLQQSGDSFDDFDEFDQRYTVALDRLRESIPMGVRFQEVDRGFLPNFVFGPDDIIVTLGPDGLVVNTAKYLQDQLIVAFNPDPTRIDGVLARFNVLGASQTLQAACGNVIAHRDLVMAQATLNNGQTLLAVNDLFIGQRTHVSARYQIRYRHQIEQHSSSGVIVSTGAGSTGWYRSIVTGAAGITATVTEVADAHPAFAWSPEEPELRFSVREPFESKASQVGICAGQIGSGETLEIASNMPKNGVIFSDGVEEDYLEFNSGSVARIGIAARRVRLAGRIPQPL